MDAIKILAALVVKFGDAETGEVHLTIADLNAAVVADRTNLSVRATDDGLHLTAVNRAEALADQRAAAVRQPALPAWAPPVGSGRRRV